MNEVSLIQRVSISELLLMDMIILSGAEQIVFQFLVHQKLVKTFDSEFGVNLSRIGLGGGMVGVSGGATIIAIVSVGVRVGATRSRGVVDMRRGVVHGHLLTVLLEGLAVVIVATLRVPAAMNTEIGWGLTCRVEWAQGSVRDLVERPGGARVTGPSGATIHVSDSLRPSSCSQVVSTWGWLLLWWWWWLMGVVMSRIYLRSWPVGRMAGRVDLGNARRRAFGRVPVRVRLHRQGVLEGSLMRVLVGRSLLGGHARSGTTVGMMTRRACLLGCVLQLRRVEVARIAASTTIWR